METITPQDIAQSINEVTAFYDSDAAAMIISLSGEVQELNINFMQIEKHWSDALVGLNLLDYISYGTST